MTPSGMRSRGPVFGEHSKALGGQRFSAEAREAQLARVRSDHGPEIAAALDWPKLSQRAPARHWRSAILCSA